MYLSEAQAAELGRLLKTFFALPYSTDLDGKDAEKIIRLVKGCTGRFSRRKELFDIVEGCDGLSIKTLRKPPTASRVDLQEQRFCDVDQLRRMMAGGDGNAGERGRLLLNYMRNRIREQMKARGVTVAKSAILLKWWNKPRTEFAFRYWEEDLLGYIENLWERNERGELEWVIQPAGLHARDTLRQDEDGKNVRLLRMHQKHNQIFTDHDIPGDAVKVEFAVEPLTLPELANLLNLK